MLISFIKKIYNQQLEDLCVRLLYFFNTIDTYFIVAGVTTFLICFFNIQVNPVMLISGLLLGIFTAKLADFYPAFVLLAFPVLIVWGIFLQIPLDALWLLLILNVLLFFIIQFGLMGIPDSIVARDPKVAFIKMFNSLFTIAPTTVSLIMSVFFSSYLAYCLYISSICKSKLDFILYASGAIVLIIASLITRLLRPINRFSKFHKPDTPSKPIFKRLLILNIDGARKDVFDKLNLPTYSSLKKKGAWHEKGLETVYRALTNPAFASIFTGTIPTVHGVRDNNFGQSIQSEGLPDLIPSIAYGSMHVQHFSKKYWETRIVSLPEHSVYKSDDIMVDWLKDDLENRPEIRLFVADFSEADFLAHAYGSKSQSYKEALQRIDKRIGDVVNWLKEKKMDKDTGIIVCSDHGIAAIDHSYLIAESEKYVPFLIYGPGVKKNLKITSPGKIMDICCTAAYLLGIPYPKDSRGQVFTEALEKHDRTLETTELVSRFNALSYDIQASKYNSRRTEVVEGDSAWWRNSILQLFKTKSNLNVLDIGCGTGFVAEHLQQSQLKIQKYVGVDISDKALEYARKSISKDDIYSFQKELPKTPGEFDIITVSSVLHHLYQPEELTGKLNLLLKPGGVIIGSHEPNRTPFYNLCFRLAASFYKLMGGGVNLDRESVLSFNQLLQSSYPKSPIVCHEEIMQIVEYHSPVEQFDYGVDKQSGFIPSQLIDQCFKGFEEISLEYYSTCFYRPWLNKHKFIQAVLVKLYQMAFSGNLFRYILRKPTK